MNRFVLSAIFRRNFSSYFANPTGYVFICVFVLLSSFAAFWPNEFFTANLATLDQLNHYFPWIMLIFIPAITMSIWAEERRQGTDELLLTIPATDLDVVLGKYLAAVAIYSVSLLFSAVCNIFVLGVLGQPDLGLWVATYFGYFLVGLAMLSIGMVASFLTNNITVGFVLGAMFNAPLVFAEKADAISTLPTEWVVRLKSYSISEQLRDFSAGVISLSSTAYFLAIVVVMLYLAMVLIGKRHWAGGRDGTSLAPHFAVRAVAMTAAAVGLLWIFSIMPVRKDLSTDKLSTLADGTKELVKKLDAKRPVHIEAFISPSVPEKAYIEGLPGEHNLVPIRLDLITRLREIAAYGGKNITLRIVDTEPFSEQSDRAEKLYGIKGQKINAIERGQAAGGEIFMGVAITSGLDKVIIPFVGPSTPIEYELVRSLATLNGVKKKRLGLFIADKTALQDFDNETRAMKESQILSELRQQYDVVDVDAAKPVPSDIDVLMAVQPSALQPNQIDNLTAAVRSGVPTVIFEDAFSIAFPSIRQAEERGSQFPFMQETETKKLWDLLGVDVVTQQIANHFYNPILDQPEIPAEYVFIGNGALGNQPSQSLFDENDPISSKTQELVFMFPGWITKKENAKLKFTALARTSPKSGYVDKLDLMTRDPFGGGGLNPRRRKHPSGAEYVIAARIQGPPPPEAPAVKPAADEKPAADPKADDKPKSAADAPKNEVKPAPSATPSATASGTKPAESPQDTAKRLLEMNQQRQADLEALAKTLATPTATASGTAASEKAAEPKKPRDMDVVIFSDLDFLSNAFFQFRSQRQGSEAQRLNFDNVAVVLNAIDVLAGDDRFVEIRKRRPTYRTLKTLDEVNQAAQSRLTQSENEYKDRFEEEIKKEERRLNDELDALRKDTKLKQIDKESRLEIFSNQIERRLKAKRQQLETQLEKHVKELKREQTDQIRRRQYYYKMWAVVLPVIPPLLIGLVVFFNRRAREQEGVERSRLR